MHHTHLPCRKRRTRRTQPSQHGANSTRHKETRRWHTWCLANCWSWQFETTAKKLARRTQELQEHLRHRRPVPWDRRHRTTIGNERKVNDKSEINDTEGVDMEKGEVARESVLIKIPMTFSILFGIFRSILWIFPATHSFIFKKKIQKKYLELSRQNPCE